LKLSIIKHKLSQFIYKGGSGIGSNYLLFYMLKHLLLSRKIENCKIIDVDSEPSTDLAIMHADITHLDAEYVNFSRRFSVCLNSAVTDISKKTTSDLTVRSGDNAQGPFIVKANLNYAGLPEHKANKLVRDSGLEIQLPFPGVELVKEYSIVDSLDKLPENIFDDANLTVERFLPEKVGDYYAIRHYFFCGEAEICNQYLSESPMIKGDSVIKKIPCELPVEVRERRKAMGFDYGKFDFVMHDGKPFIFDTNKTPGRPPLALPATQAMISELAEGLYNLLCEHHS